jgi:hypothetical protein
MPSVKSKIENWYTGKYTPHENPANSPLYFVGGYYKRHWTAVAAHVVVEFYLREWKWVITAAMTLAGLLIAYSKLR